MVVLGLLLVLAAGALTVGVVVANTDSATVSAFGQSLSGLTLGGLFLAGAITGAVAILGLTMMLAGMARRRARRVGLRRQMRDERQEKETLAEENARLRSQLDGSHSDADVYPSDVVRDASGAGSHSRTTSRGLFRR
jgi:hypothetical protein